MEQLLRSYTKTLREIGITTFRSILEEYREIFGKFWKNAKVREIFSGFWRYFQKILKKI